MNITVNSPKISIIIGTYGRGKLTLETITSIQQQTYRNWELIIVDDGSEDNTEELIRSIPDERIQFIKAGRIGITGKIKNIGIAKTKGDLIAFNDSDDLWHPTKLEKQVKALLQFPEAGFCLTGGYTFLEKGKPFEMFYKQDGIYFGDIFSKIFSSQVACYTQALMIKRSCLDVVGNFPEEGRFSDYEFIIALARSFKAVIIYEPLFFRRLHEKNYHQPNWEQGYETGLAMIKKYKSDLPRDVYADALFKTYLRFGETAAAHNRKGFAVKKIFKAWLIKPFSLVPLKKILKAFLP